jgi:tetratricopeptide (TPR) repeat protein
MLKTIKYKDFIWLLIICGITLFVYLPVFENQFLNWDDSRYITENDLIKDLTFQKAISYFTSYYDGHYHPLTMLSLAIDFKLGGQNPWWFHFSSLLLHLINIGLVFYFTKLIIVSYQNNQCITHSKEDKSKSITWIIPLIVTLLFAIHPINVESVAWMSERKNVLFVMFFLLSLILYINYLNQGSKKVYILSFLLFSLSILSKVTAISLTFTLFIIDYFLNRNISIRRSILEKLPFILLTVTFVIIGIYAQRNTWGNEEETGYSFYERIPLAANSLLQYFVKLIIPYNLSGFYPYPARVDGTVPFIYWLSFIPLILLLIGLWISLFRKKNTIVGFGLLFFIINIIFLIKLMDFPIGNNKMGDRYAYLPGLGIFWLIGWFVYKIRESNSLFQGKVSFVILLFLMVLPLGIKAQQRIKTWETDLTLFMDVIKSYPDCTLAWNNIGMQKKLAGDRSGAIEAFTKVLKLDLKNSSALLNRGSTFAELSKFNEAIVDFTTLLQLDANNGNAYLNRGMAYGSLKKWEFALRDYDNAITIIPTNTLALTNRGVIKASIGELDSALVDFNRSIEIDSLYANSYFNRGNIKARKKDFVGAIVDYSKVIQLSPNNIAAYMNRAEALFLIRNYIDAIKDYNFIIKIYPEDNFVLYKKALATLNSGNKNEACDQFKELKKRGMGLLLPDVCD